MLLDYRNPYCVGFVIIFSLLIAKEVKGQTEANDTGILTDLWSSLTSIGKTPSCPGECVHAITSIFCDNVLEEVTCGATFLRCCVPHEFSFGTPVETSAPIPENGQSPHVNSNNHSPPQTPQSTTTTTTTTTTTSTTVRPTEAHSITSHPLMIRPHNPKPYMPSMVFGSLNMNQMQPSPPSSPPSSSTTSTTTTTSSTTTTSTTQRPTSVTSKTPSTESSTLSTESNVSKDSPPLAQPCPGICIRKRYARYCGNILSNGKCNNEDDQCCLQSEIDFNNSSSIVTVVQQSDASNDSINHSKADQIPEIVNQTGPTMQSTPMPLCEGTCVAPLFSLLCDETDYSLYCPNGGSCCVNKEPTTEAPPPIKPCPGTCIPTILSGMCNRPSELILKTTDCSSGSICCHNPKGEENGEPIQDEHVEESRPSSVTPVTPPTNPQNYRPIMFPGNNYNPGQQQPMPPLLYGPETPIGSLPFMPPHSPPAIKPPPPPPLISPPSVPKQELPPEMPPPMPDRNPIEEGSTEDNKSVIIRPPGGPPFCPGPCIAPMFRFTCFGGNAIYPKFQCAKGGHLCCAPMSDIQAFEASVLANNGVWKTQIPLNKTTVYDDSPIRPPPPRRPNPYMCGIKGTQRKETPRVVGGSDSYPGEWCWQIALINSQNQYLCGGALIGAQWVLTAAHCITNLVRNGDAIYVRVGDYDLTSQTGSRGAQTQRVSTTYIHHNHNGQTLDNDIALLKLQSPVELNEAVCLVCLPARGSKRKPGKRCTVTGYGYKDESGPIALKVRKRRTVPVVDDQECTVKINSVTEKLFILPASSFCAGGDDGNDACQGDGGSGLTCETDGYYELTGLVSWGFGCGRNGVPGVYVKVSAFVGWINQIISVNNQ